MPIRSALNAQNALVGLSGLGSRGQDEVDERTFSTDVLELWVCGSAGI